MSPVYGENCVWCLAMSGFWRTVLCLHLLAMAFFVGGQLVFGIAVVPILRKDPDRERMREIARRSRGAILLASLVIVWLGWNLLPSLAKDFLIKTGLGAIPVSSVI